MPAIADVIIRQSPRSVWAVIADPSKHPDWLESHMTTVREGELAEGKKFTLVDNSTGQTLEGEILSVRIGSFLKVRIDFPDRFETTEYHLIAVEEGCAVRVLCDLYDTGEVQHLYFPDMVEEKWRTHLEKLRDFCESTS